MTRLTTQHAELYQKRHDSSSDDDSDAGSDVDAAAGSDGEGGLLDELEGLDTTNIITGMRDVYAVSDHVMMNIHTRTCIQVAGVRVASRSTSSRSMTVMMTMRMRVISMS